MKYAAIVSLFLLLTACIEVDDLGEYWDKATIDPNIAGWWKSAYVADEDGVLKNNETLFFVKDSAYEEYNYQCTIKKHLKSCKASAPSNQIKTITLGHYTYLIQGPETKGVLLFRYEVLGDTLKSYDLKVDAAWAFIEKTYPQNSNISKKKYDDSDDKGAAYLEITLLTDQAAEVLSKIPDSEIYWTPTGTLSR